MTLRVRDLAMLYSVLRGFSDRGTILGFMAVRPVVVLKSDVMATEVPKIADQASTWTYVVK